MPNYNEITEALIYGIQRRRIIAVRRPDGELGFVATEHATNQHLANRIDDDDAIAEMQASLVTCIDLAVN